MYLFALDLSLECTGISIFELKTAKPVYVGVIHRKSSETHGKSLRRIAKEFVNLRKQFPPSLIIIERAFNQFNKSTEALYKVHGIANYIFFDIEQKLIVASHWKKIILAGNATKEMCQRKVLMHYPDMTFTSKSYDDSDSFCLGLSYFIENGIVKWIPSLRNDLDKKENKKKSTKKIL